jgi:hypothetical protein
MNPDSPGPNLLAEVKYYLPQMLAELKAERATGTFGMEKIEQPEIAKLFKAKSTRGKFRK